MKNTEELQGWGAIELYTGLSRNTLLSQGYPIRKTGGTVWAMKAEIEEFKLSNSVNLCQILRKSVKDTSNPL